MRQARTVASMRSRATLVGTRPGDSHARTDCASHWAARGASHGAAGETFFAMELIRAMAWPALTSAIGLILGMSPRYRRTFPPVASTLSPSTNVLNVLTPVSFASACRRSWFGPMKQPPMSTGTPPSGALGPDPPADPVPRFEHHDRLPGLGQASGRRQPGEARPDHADVRFQGPVWHVATSQRSRKLTCVLPACK